jgi:hypothetical protein
MNSSIDWTSPEAYDGPFIPAPPKRTQWQAIAVKLRVFVRDYRREQRRLRELYELRQAARYMNERMRRDIGLPF